jgi:hypothetical protein
MIYTLLLGWEWAPREEIRRPREALWFGNVLSLMRICAAWKCIKENEEVLLLK